MFNMMKDESIKGLSSRFSSIVNEHKSLGIELESEDIVRKIIRILTDKWQPKMTTIEEAKDLSKLSLNELMGSLMAHELTLMTRSGEYSKASGFAVKLTTSDDEQAMNSRNMAGASDSDEDERLEEELEASVCMTTRLDHNGPKYSKNGSALCLMAHSDNSHDDSDTEALVKGRNNWYLDSGCSRHMTRNEDQFLSLEAYNGGTVMFGDNNKGEIIAIGMVGKSSSQCVEKVLHVKGLMYNLLSISQLCGNGNIAEFCANECRVLNSNTREIILEGKRVKDVNLTNLCALSSRTMSCVSALKKNDPWLSNKRLGHVNTRTLNTLKRLYLVDGIPNIKFD
ncbi:uncharacterized protein LOC141631909 [Silene latifolia]|uniref:uncharacterized protein LOC141631909 n=1 Tax=Silene latifolia TaxID=37657 RepID=UPI003D7757FD